MTTQTTDLSDFPAASWLHPEGRGRGEGAVKALGGAQTTLSSRQLPRGFVVHLVDPFGNRPTRAFCGLDLTLAVVPVDDLPICKLCQRVEQRLFL